MAYIGLFRPCHQDKHDVIIAPLMQETRMSQKVVNSIELLGEYFTLYHYIETGNYAECSPALIVDNRNIVNVTCAYSKPTPDSVARAECAIRNYVLNGGKGVIVPASAYGHFDHERFTEVTPLSSYAKQAALVFTVEDAIKGLHSSHCYSFTIPVNNDGVFDEMSSLSSEVPSIAVEYIKDGVHITFVIFDHDLMEEYARAFNAKQVNSRNRLTRETEGMRIALKRVH